MISIFYDQLSVWCKLICTLELFQIVVHLGWDVLDLLFSNNNYSDRNISVHSRWGSKAEKAIPVVNLSISGCREWYRFGARRGEQVSLGVEF